MMVVWAELALLAPLDPLVQWWRERRCLDLLDLQVWMGPLECQAILDLKEKWELEETWVPEGLLVKMDFRDRLDFKASRAEWEMLASQAYKVRRETLVLLGKWDLRASRELLDFLDSQVNREFLVCQEIR